MAVRGGHGVDASCRSVGWVRVRNSRRERARFLKLLRVRGVCKFSGCGAVVGKNVQPVHDSTVDPVILNRVSTAYKQLK